MKNLIRSGMLPHSLVVHFAQGRKCDMLDSVEGCARRVLSCFACASVAVRDSEAI